MPAPNALYAQSGGPTAAINAIAQGIIKALRKPACTPTDPALPPPGMSRLKPDGKYPLEKSCLAGAAASFFPVTIHHSGEK